ncbi:MAG TPA: hypothetical protein VGK49_02115, partial [Ilumatobacteraceae bacterium]
MRATAAAGLCGLGLLAARVAGATGAAAAGGWRSLIARLDAGAPVLVALGSAAVLLPFVSARLGATPRPSTRGFLTRAALVAYALWLPVMVLNELMVDPEWTPRSLLQTIVFFRELGSAPTAGLSIGLVLFLVASVAVLAPIADRLVARRDREAARLMWLAGCLVL